MIALPCVVILYDKWIMYTLRVIKQHVKFTFDPRNELRELMLVIKSDHGRRRHHKLTLISSEN